MHWTEFSTIQYNFPVPTCQVNTSKSGFKFSVVKAWDFTVGGGYKSALKSFGNGVRNVLNKTSIGRGILNVYDGCKSVVNKVYDKYKETKNRCKSKLNKLCKYIYYISDHKWS